MAHESKTLLEDVAVYLRSRKVPKIGTQRQLRAWMVSHLLPYLVEQIQRKYDVIVFDVDLTISTMHSRGYSVFKNHLPLYIKECIPMDFFLFVLRMHLDGVRIGFATNSDSLDSVPHEGKLCGKQLIHAFMTSGLHQVIIHLFGRRVPVKIRRKFVRAMVRQLPMVGARQSVRNAVKNDYIDPHDPNPMRIEDAKLLDIVYTQSKTRAKYDLHQLPSGKCWHMAALETLRPGFLPQNQETGIFLDDDMANRKNMHLFHHLTFVHCPNGVPVTAKKGVRSCFDGDASYKVAHAFTIPFWNQL